MPIKLYTLSALLLLCAANIRAQQPATPKNECGTRGITPWFDHYRQHRDAYAAARGSDTAWLYVPVTFHITGTDNGTGYYPMEQALLSLCRMNEHYAPAHIRFYIQPGDPARYYDNSFWHTHNWDGGAELIETNFIPERLNIFVVDDPAGNCGYSWYDAIVMAQNCSGPNNSTWAHEAGHHFSLPHTFYGWEGVEWDFTQPAPPVLEDGWGNLVEKTDHSNCYDAGDYFCDTPPDYLSNRWECNANNQSNTVQLDPDSIPFRSDGTLLMSYSSISCRNRFSEEQITAMRDNLQSEHLWYLQVDSPEPAVDPNTPVVLTAPLDSQLVQYDNFTLQWEPVPNATFYTVEISLFNNNSFQPRLVSETVYDATSLTVQKTGMPNNRTLFWRVRPYNEWSTCKSAAPQQVGIFKTKNFMATNELEEKVLASLSPNPVSAGAEAQLLLTAEESMDAILQLHDAAGRNCLLQNLQLQVGENSIAVPTGILPTGIYTLSVRNEHGIIFKKLAVAGR